MFNPVRVFNIALTNAFLTRVRELSVSYERGDGNETSPIYRSTDEKVSLV